MYISMFLNKYHLYSEKYLFATEHSQGQINQNHRKYDTGKRRGYDAAPARGLHEDVLENKQRIDDGS